MALEHVDVQQRHAQEFSEYQEELRLRYPLRPKFSRDLLNTRRIQQVWFGFFFVEQIFFTWSLNTMCS
jgi:predicted secreted protein